MRIFVYISLFAAIAAAQPMEWQSEAQWRRLLHKSVHGTLFLNEDGVQFRSPDIERRWPFVELHSFHLSLRKLTLATYDGRFEFTLRDPLPAAIAAQFTERVGRPVRNERPLPDAAAITEIPAHRRVWSGGSSGTLRLKDDGIDYLTDGGRDSRAWRWEDIQTLANPNPYELRVSGFREIVEFDLKKPLSRAVFERMWDRLYATNEEGRP